MCSVSCCTARVLYGPDLEETDWTVPRYRSGSTIAPLLFSLKEFQYGTSSRSTPSSVLYIIHNRPGSKTQKMSQSFSNNINSLNTINNFTLADDRSNILAWLSPLNPKLRHRDIQDHRVENLGEWVIQTEEFRSWHASSGGDGSDNAVLFCYGDPGVGKTFIR